MFWAAQARQVSFEGNVRTFGDDAVSSASKGVRKTPMARCIKRSNNQLCKSSCFVLTLMVWVTKFFTLVLGKNFSSEARRGSWGRGRDLQSTRAGQNKFLAKEALAFVLSEEHWNQSCCRYFPYDLGLHESGTLMFQTGFGLNSFCTKQIFRCNIQRSRRLFCSGGSCLWWSGISAIPPAFLNL